MIGILLVLGAIVAAFLNAIDPTILLCVVGIAVGLFLGIVQEEP